MLLVGAVACGDGSGAATEASTGAAESSGVTQSPGLEAHLEAASASARRLLGEHPTHGAIDAKVGGAAATERSGAAASDALGSGDSLLTARHRGR